MEALLRKEIEQKKGRYYKRRKHKEGIGFNSPLDFHQKIRGGGAIRLKLGVSFPERRHTPLFTPSLQPLINEGESGTNSPLDFHRTNTITVESPCQGGKGQ